MARKWGATRKRQKTKAFKQKKVARAEHMASERKRQQRRTRPWTTTVRVYVVPSIKETD